jgi:hypothetical protein
MGSRRGGGLQQLIVYDSVCVTAKPRFWRGMDIPSHMVSWPGPCVGQARAGHNRTLTGNPRDAKSVLGVGVGWGVCIRTRGVPQQSKTINQGNCGPHSDVINLLPNRGVRRPGKHDC